MVHDKKHSGGNDKRTSQAASAQRHRGGKKRQRHAQRNVVPSANAPSAAFLASLEAQRAKQTALTNSVDPRQQVDSATDVVTAPQVPAQRAAIGSGNCPQTSARAALPGFYYDEAKGRYFKLTKEHLQVRQRKQRAQTYAVKADHRKQNHIAVGAGRSIRRRGWMGYLAGREFLAAGAVQHRDYRELMPRFYASQFADRVLSRFGIEIDAARDRFTAMEISPDSSRMFMGYASGHVRSFTLPAESGGSFLERERIDTGGLTISSVRHHRQSLGVLVSAVGTRVQDGRSTLLVRGGGRAVGGRVGLFTDSTFHQVPHVWKVNDPWIVEWCPQESNLFSVGLGGEQGAALIDYSASLDGEVTMMASPGRIKSDTLSQTFSPQSSTTIVNGARNGSWWIWDTRARRRATEVIDSKGKSTGSFQCIRLLKDERRLVTQRSDGELAVLDLRSPSHSPVLLFCSGEPDAYRSMLRFDVDENETVVAAATAPSVSIFDLSRGIERSQLRVAVSEQRAEEVANTAELHAVEQVILTDTQREPTFWGLSRSALYRSTRGFYA